MKYVLFDLDGTLTESGPGIMNSVGYALGKMNRPSPGEEVLRQFIGPPLKNSFMTLCGMTEKEAGEAIRLYRYYFSTRGIFENSPYDGVADMLATLSAAGLDLGVASSKPEVFVKRILDHFGLTPYFSHITGALMDETRTRKDEVLQEALSRIGCPPAGKVLMVGDKSHDVEGARVHGIRTVAVLYGYGTVQEFEQARPYFTASTVGDLTAFLLKWAKQP